MVAVDYQRIDRLEPVLETVPRPKLSLVVPAYNEQVRIANTLTSTIAFLKRQPYQFELIVADDGSTDNTRAIAERYVSDDVRVVTIPHGGKAVALRAGMKVARGEIVAFTDADLATPIEYLTEFIRAIDNGADVVIGSREGTGAHRVDEPGYRHFMGRVFNKMVQTLVLPGINDTQCGFKAFTRFASLEINRRARLYVDQKEIVGARVTAFDVEMLVIARNLGLSIVEMPVSWTYGQQSKVNPVRDSLTNLKDIATIKANTLRSRYD